MLSSRRTMQVVTNFLESEGYPLLLFWTNDVLVNADGALRFFDAPS